MAYGMELNFHSDQPIIQFKILNQRPQKGGKIENESGEWEEVKTGWVNLPKWFIVPIICFSRFGGIEKLLLLPSMDICLHSVVAVL